MFQVLYPPNEPAYFLDFVTSWIRILIQVRIQEAFLYADPW